MMFNIEVQCTVITRIKGALILQLAVSAACRFVQ